MTLSSRRRQIPLLLSLSLLWAGMVGPLVASDLDVKTNANFTGTYGLEVSLDTPGVAYVQDDTPSNEVQYNARFYVDPTMLNGCPTDCAVAIFQAFSSSNGSPFEARLRRNSQGFFVQFRITTDTTTFYPKWQIPGKGWSAVEVEWTAASSSSTADGAIDFWINGNGVSGFANLPWGQDNNIDYVRLGNPGLNTFSGGEIKFDDFESRRGAYIGLITDQPLAPPVPTYPKGSITDSTPRLNWTNVPGATEYQTWVKSVNSNSIVVNQRTTASNFTTSALNTNHNYLWRVRTRSNGGWGPMSPWLAFGYGPASPPPQPTALGPSGTISDPTPDLTWTASTGATRYQIYIRDLDTNTYLDNNNQITATSYNVGPLDTSHSYQWRVRAYNSAGWSSMTPWMYFNYLTGPPAAPVIIGPTGSTSSPPTYSWNAASGATRYQVYVQPAAGGGNIENPNQITNTSYTGTPLSSGSYRWRVRGYNSAFGWGPMSPWQTFSIP